MECGTANNKTKCILQDIEVTCGHHDSDKSEEEISDKESNILVGRVEHFLENTCAYLLKFF